MDKTLGYMLASVATGLVCLLLEIVTPSFGILAGAAIAAFVSAIVLGFYIDPLLGLLMIVLAMAMIPLYLYGVVKILPKSPLGRKLFLRSAKKADGDATPEAEKYLSLVGKSGVAETTLRPSGAIRIEGKRIIASAESGLIEEGTNVEVINSTGMNVIVRPVK